MPFGLQISPTTFMSLMDDKLHPLTEYFVVEYLDDIVILNNIGPKHLQHIQQVLDTLWKNKLYANLGKCFFGMNIVQ